MSRTSERAKLSRPPLLCVQIRFLLSESPALPTPAPVPPDPWPFLPLEPFVSLYYDLWFFRLTSCFHVCLQCPHELPCPQLTASKPLACSFSQAYHPIPFSWVCILGILQQGGGSLGKQDEKESGGGSWKIPRAFVEPECA